MPGNPKNRKIERKKVRFYAELGKFCQKVLKVKNHKIQQFVKLLKGFGNTSLALRLCPKNSEKSLGFQLRF